MISFIIIYERVKILTENISEEQVNNDRKERRRKRKKLQYGAKFYCPFFTFILIFCLLQLISYTEFFKKNFNLKEKVL